jgi:hypothetical protein
MSGWRPLRATGSPGKVTYWLGTGTTGQPGDMAREFCRCPTKPEAMKHLKAFIDANPPASEYASAQIAPYTATGRKWGVSSVRYNASRKGWKKGEGIK